MVKMNFNILINLECKVKKEKKYPLTEIPKGNKLCETS